MKTGFRIQIASETLDSLAVPRAEFLIPEPRIQDSTNKNFQDSGIRITSRRITKLTGCIIARISRNKSFSLLLKGGCPAGADWPLCMHGIVGHSTRNKCLCINWLLHYPHLPCVHLIYQILSVLYCLRALRASECCSDRFCLRSVHKLMTGMIEWDQKSNPKTPCTKNYPSNFRALKISKRHQMI